MARSTDVVILGSGFRGLWLSAQLVKLGWKVTWFPVHSPQGNRATGGFIFDDWPLQGGPVHPKSRLVPLVREFVEEVFKPTIQEVSVQVVTPQGPLELSGGAESLALKKFFTNSWREIEEYFSCIKKSRQMEEKKGQQLLFAHTKKIFEKPLSQRWILEWLGNLRRSRAVSTDNRILSWFRDVLDPELPLWVFNDSHEEVCARGMKWAQGRGVDVRGQDILVDVGVEGRKARGIEVHGGEGFLEAKYIISACSHEVVLKKLPTLGRYLESPVKANSEKWVWIRCGFLLKPNTRPEGLFEFSSFVIDPYMPLVEGNVGFTKWVVGEKNDHLTVWVRIPFGDLKRRSYLMNLTEDIQKHLRLLFPRFERELVAVLPFEEYFHSPEVSHDDLAIVFDGIAANQFAAPKSKLQNVWLMDATQDRGLEVLSKLATECRMLREMTKIRNKELKKSDRKIHSARNGQNLVRAK